MSNPSTGLPPIDSNVTVRLIDGVTVTGVVTGHGTKDGKPTFDFECDHRTPEGQTLKMSKWAWPEQVQRNLDNFDVRLERAKEFCISRAGSGNRESTREFCSCIEHPDGEKLIAELVRGSHANQKLAAGIRLLFTPESLIEIADRFGVDALPVSGELDDAIDVRCADFADQTVDSSGPTP